MTVLIGFSCPDFTILGADGRGISASDWNDIDENCQKLFRSGIGVIGGAGRSDVIYAVTHRLKDHTPASNQEASEIIRTEVAKLGLAPDDPGLERTCWLGSYATNGENQVETRLALAHRGANYAFDPFNQNQVIILRPSDMSEELGRQFMTAAQRQLDERMARTPAEQRVAICISMIADLVSAISKLSSMVGPRWSVGVHLADGNAAAISNVGEDRDEIEWQ